MNRAFGILTAVLAAAGATAEDAVDFRIGFISKHCVSCHGSERPSGGFAIASAVYDLTDRDARRKWEQVSQYVETSVMPPRTAQPQPLPADREQFVSALRSDMAEADRAAKVGATPIRRLNRIEYLNSLRDLFPIRQIKLPYTFPEDHTDRGFDTISDGLHLSPAHLEANLDVATDIADRMVPLPDPRTMESTSDVTTIGVDRRWFSEDKTYLRFTGVNIGGWSGAVWDATFVAHECGVYRVRLFARSSSEAALGADGKPFRLAFHVFDPTELQLPKRMLRVDAPRVAAVEVDRNEYAWLDVDVPLEAGETFHIYLENRFPEGSHPARGVITSQLNQFVAEARENPAPTAHIEQLVVRGPIDILPRQREFLRSGVRNGSARLDQGVGPSAASAAKPPEPADLDAILSPLAERAFRRPLSAAEKDEIVSIAEAHGEQTGDPLLGVHYGIRRILTSPHFLYRESAEGPLDEHDLASRLSYFLWSTMPDKELLDLAAAGRLSNPRTLRAQVFRMLAGPRSEQLVKHFTGQWLGNRKAASINICDNRYFWSELVRYGFLRSTEMFFEEILRRNLSIRNFIDSDFSYANLPMRMVWGYPYKREMTDLETDQRQSLAWPEPTRLDLTSLGPEAPRHVASRGGVLGLSSVLTATGDGVESSPILRGVWILTNLFGSPPPPPPADIPAIDIDTSKANTVREILAAHQQAESCAICHRKIDPLGLAMENYDAIGGWRTAYAAGAWTNADGRMAPAPKDLIDPSGVFPEGTQLSGPQDIKDYLMARPHLFTKTLASLLLEYGTGRELSVGDERVVEEMAAEEPAGGYLFQNLIAKLVSSEAFTTR